MKLSRIAAYDQLPPAERLLATILRDDKPAAERLLSEHDRTLVADLLRLAQSEKLNYLLLDKLVETGLIDALNEAERKDLNFRAGQETILQKNSDKRFEQILALLSQFGNKIVWIKGTSLSRTVYPTPAQRSTGDFDLVVNPDHADEIIATLFKHGYGCLDGGAFCNQFGVGPVGTAKDLLLAPHEDWLPTSFMALRRGDSDILDIKLSPFDRGLRLYNPEQFFAGANAHTCRIQKYYAPSDVYHLALTVHNLDKDRFHGWKHLYDIHLLANQISQLPSLWQQFLALCEE
ncbi:MAG TPA: nucleotidyltransferase family protein, partial [Chroococcales cyanobacterium]